jgi:hypothetical protein
MAFAVRGWVVLTVSLCHAEESTGVAIDVI